MTTHDEHWRALCAELHDDDGQPHRRPSRRRGRTMRDRKEAQLGQQIAQSLSLSLAADFEDPALQDLTIDDVELLAGGTIARVLARPAHEEVDVEELQRRLEAITGALRQAISRDIHRKLTPELRLVLLPFGAREL